MEGKGMNVRIELFVVATDQTTLDARNALEELGFEVVAKACPPSTADWVEFPFVRAPSGSAYYGIDGVRAFVARTKKQLQVS